MTLNGRYAPLQKKNVYGAHQADGRHTVAHNRALRYIVRY